MSGDSGSKYDFTRSVRLHDVCDSASRVVVTEQVWTLALPMSDN